MRVLVIDDSADLRTLVRLALTTVRDVSMDVVGEGRTGLDAIALAAALRPDVIVLDHAMPHMTGIDALPGVRAAAPAARVVLFTASPPAELGPGSDGPDEVVQKLDGIGVLLDAVARCLVCDGRAQEPDGAGEEHEQHRWSFVPEQ